MKQNKALAGLGSIGMSGIIIPIQHITNTGTFKGVRLNFNKAEVEVKVHKRDVRKNMVKITNSLTDRALKHDDDKFNDIENWARFQVLDKAGFKFGTPEHKKLKEELDIRGTIDRHTDNNRHHPEFFDRDLSKMNIIDITEMIVDWYAASTRRASGKGVSFEEMMEYQQKRFKMSDELKGILLNTLNWLKNK